jgi:hypothetical protein
MIRRWSEGRRRRRIDGSEWNGISSESPALTVREGGGGGGWKQLLAKKILFLTGRNSFSSSSNCHWRTAKHFLNKQWLIAKEFGMKETIGIDSFVDLLKSVDIQLTNETGETSLCKRKRKQVRKREMEIQEGRLSHSRLKYFGTILPTNRLLSRIRKEFPSALH